MSSRRGRRREPGVALDAVAGCVQRVAVLLAAGLDPLSALRALDDPPPALLAAARCSTAHEVPDALVDATSPDDAEAWALLAACWAVAVEAGAPLAATLDRAADALRALADADRQVELAFAGPLATARIVSLLPLLGLGMGVLMGADPLGVLVGTVPGAVAGVLGVGALVAGMRWSRRLVAAARVADPLAGVGAELLALALAGGGSPDRGVALVESVAARCGIGPDLDEARATLEFATRVGVPASALLRAEAARSRRVALAAVLRQAAVLGTRLLGPLAVCFLPSFVLVGVVPLAIGMLRGALASF